MKKIKKRTLFKPICEARMKHCDNRFHRPLSKAVLTKFRKDSFFFLENVDTNNSIK